MVKMNGLRELNSGAFWTNHVKAPMGKASAAFAQRNHMVEGTLIVAAGKQDFQPHEQLLQAVACPTTTVPTQNGRQT
jgi:hypothetical protein